MGIKVFEIFLENPQRSYVAGQKLTGWLVILVLDQVKKVQGVTIRLSGQANTHWSECSGRTTRTVGDCEHYINKKIILYGSDDNPGSKELGLQPGCHEFPFSFTLPATLPSSFEHKYGSVRYLLEATIIRLAKSDSTTKLSFTVQGNVNLNHEPNYTEALLAKKSCKKTTNYCLCFTSGPIGYFCKIPPSGYVPGENNNDNPGSKELGLQPGCHEFPFSFTLPATLPSSFEHKYGSVRYLLEATIIRLAKSDSTTKLSFTVQGNVNLNHEPNYTEALLAKKSCKKTTNYCLCFTSGPIGYFCKIPPSGYVPGENIPFSAELYNFSQRPVQKVTLSLVQETKFTAKSSILRSKNKSITVLSIRGPALGPGADETWCPEGFKVPDIPPTKLGGCSIISVSYCLKFKVEVKNSNTLKSKLGILIGTIPIRLASHYLSLTGMAMQQSQLIRNELRLPSSSTAALSNTYSQPPPRYEDVVAEENNRATSQEDCSSTKTCSSENPPDYEESFRLQLTSRTEN